MNSSSEHEESRETVTSNNEATPFAPALLRKLSRLNSQTIILPVPDNVDVPLGSKSPRVREGMFCWRALDPSLFVSPLPSQSKDRDVVDDELVQILCRDDQEIRRGRERAWSLGGDSNPCHSSSPSIVSFPLLSSKSALKKASNASETNLSATAAAGSFHYVQKRCTDLARDIFGLWFLCFPTIMESSLLPWRVSTTILDAIASVLPNAYFAAYVGNGSSFRSINYHDIQIQNHTR